MTTNKHLHTQLNTPDDTFPLSFSAPLEFKLSLPNRSDTFKNIESGELEFIEFDAVVFSPAKKNKNGFLFEGNLETFANSFKGLSFVKDHRENLDAIFGKTLSANLSDDNFVQKIRLTTNEAMLAFIEGKIHSFSIAWFFDSVLCSICRNEIFSRDCSHFPGRKSKIDNKDVICHPIFINPTGRHTSAVSVPASQDTGLLAALSAHKEQTFEANKGTIMPKKIDDPAVPPEEKPTSPQSKLKAEIDANLEASKELLAEQDKIKDLEKFKTESLEVLIAHCGELLTAALDNSRLPLLTQDRIRKEYAGKKFLSPELHATITAAREEIAAITSLQVVTGPGRATQVFNSDDAIRAAAFDLFGAERDKGTENLKTTKLTGLKQLYLMLTGDVNFTGDIDEDSIMAHLATTTNFPAIVKDSMNKILVKSWDAFGALSYGWWKDIVTIEHFDDINTIDWVITGTIGSLPDISERGEYTNLPIGDSVETSTWTKSGGYIPITLEAILRDNLQAFKAFPRELAWAGLRNISEKVAAMFTDNTDVGPTLADTGALFNNTAITTTGGHLNLLTTALGTTYSAWEAAAAAMYNQPLHVAATIEGESFLGTGKKQAIDPKFCLHPRALKGQVEALFIPRWEAEVGSIATAGGVTYGGKVVPLTVPEWTETDHWASVADPNIIPGIMIGEIFGVMPQIVMAGRENDPAMFMNDESRLKVRQFLAIGVANYRGLHKNNV